MANISRRLEQVVNAELKNQILPVKTAEGILVGNVLIISEGTIKHLKYKDELVYKDIHLNAIAIKMANLLARGNFFIKLDELYRADCEYGRWFNDSQMLRTQYQKAISNQDFDKADILWARYCESRDKAFNAKNHAQSLASI